MITTQKEYDEADKRGWLEIGAGEEIKVTSFVYAHKGSTVRANDGSIVDAHDGSIVTAFDGSIVHAHRGSIVPAFDGSTVYAYKGSVVYAYKGSTVNADDGSTVYDRQSKPVSSEMVSREPIGRVAVVNGSQIGWIPYPEAIFKQVGNYGVDVYAAPPVAEAPVPTVEELLEIIRECWHHEKSWEYLADAIHSLLTARTDSRGGV